MITNAKSRRIGWSWVLLLCFLASCQIQSEVRVIKVAHALADSHPVHKGILEMQRALEEVSGGKMQMKIYSNGQLGKERELMELLQIGSLDMTKVSAGVLENFVPEFKVLTLPYLFEDSVHMANVLDGEIGKKLLVKAEEYNLHGVCFYDAGTRSFYTKSRPINSPEDLVGMKIRVMNSQSAFDMVNALGGSPTPVSFGELYTALEQGIVDGAENNPPSFYTSRHYEICKYYSIDEHTAVPDVLLMSTFLWSRLSDQEKEWLQAATDQSVKYQKQVWYDSVQEYLKEVQEAGVTVLYPDKAPFEAKVQGLYRSFESDPKLQELIEQIKALGEEDQIVEEDETES
ncbi:C4-dicarboxylate ABC transporter substrate-binding protein [Reichenbachiella sp. 5M10]|uniref:TRAP transporter substrate-binding protein n=1 Tax=Reichenbachiella sp. 5M10 TaxID=1889772 RepID=UPI000C14E41E|nr:TRAP transporter substrate-binding protein [Reichenbachiella sp. 5M10]PIB35774.1 C4-dicarboxylate ABC transporter substrate-binding protein [Reichenbachiella sp. 5M10]